MFIECTGQPLALVSTRYKTAKEIGQQQRVTIGVVLGSLTEGVGREIAKQFPNTVIDLIPYQSSLQATQDVLGGRVDTSIDFVGDITQWIDSGKANVVGITGLRNYPGYQTFASQGVKGFEDLISNYQIIAPKTLPQSTQEELHGIIAMAARTSPTLSDIYKRDFCTAADVGIKQTEAMFDKWKAYWPKQLAK